MNIFYVYDEYTDIADGEGANKVRDIVMDAFLHPEKPRPEGELLLGRMVQESVPPPFFRYHFRAAANGRKRAPSSAWAPLTPKNQKRTKYDSSKSSTRALCGAVGGSL